VRRHRQPAGRQPARAAQQRAPRPLVTLAFFTRVACVGRERSEVGQQGRASTCAGTRGGTALGTGRSRRDTVLPLELSRERPPDCPQGPAGSLNCPRAVSRVHSAFEAARACWRPSGGQQGALGASLRRRRCSSMTVPDRPGRGFSLVVQLAADPVVCVVEDLLDECPDVFAAGAEHVQPALLAQAHQAGEAELREVLRGGGRRRAGERTQHPDFPVGAGEQLQDPQPGRVREQGERRHGDVDLLSRGQVQVGLGSGVPVGCGGDAGYPILSCAWSRIRDSLADMSHAPTSWVTTAPVLSVTTDGWWSSLSARGPVLSSACSRDCCYRSAARSSRALGLRRSRPRQRPASQQDGSGDSEMDSCRSPEPEHLPLAGWSPANHSGATAGEQRAPRRVLQRG